MKDDNSIPKIADIIAAFKAGLSIAEIKRKLSLKGRSAQYAEILSILSEFVGDNDEWRNHIAARGMARQIFNSRQGTKAGNSACLYFDSKFVPAAPGVRPSLVSERRLKYQSDRGEIELSILPLYPGKFELTGRVNSEHRISSGRVNLCGRRKKKAAIDQFGFFVFSELNPGNYSLDLEVDGEAVSIPELNM